MTPEPTVRPWVVRALRLPLLALLLLGGCGDGKAPTVPDPPTPPPIPVPTPVDPEHLLSDQELVTPEDRTAPPENPAWTEWVRANNQPVRSLTAGTFTDLQFFKPVLAGRRLVQLGESSHGVREFNQAKVRLIRFLHEEMGFDVIAFESSLYECYQADRMVGTRTPEQTMSGCIFQVWHTEEVRALFEYIERTRATSRPLTLAGFDSQISSRSNAQGRPAFFRELVARVDTGYARRVHTMDSTLVASYVTGGYTPFQAYAQANEAALTAAYDSLALFLDRHGAEIARLDPARPELPRLAAQTARSMVAFVRQATSTSDIFARDRAMAENITFLAREMYPEKKIVVWAHNSHIRHSGQTTTYARGNAMGSWVMERHRPELYTIGFYMYRGLNANNSRQPQGVTPHPSGSLESVLYRTRRRHAFVDLLHQQRSEGSAWIFQAVTVKEWGQFAYQMVPREQYDGIFFVDTTSVPAYLWL